MTPELAYHANSPLSEKSRPHGATGLGDSIDLRPGSRSRRRRAANIRTHRLLKMKGDFCVSTGSIVGGRAPRSTAVVAGGTYWTGRRLARPKIVVVGADDADGTDGVFGPRTDPDQSGSSSAFTTEGDVDAQYVRGKCPAGCAGRARRRRATTLECGLARPRSHDVDRKCFRPAACR